MSSFDSWPTSAVVSDGASWPYGNDVGIIRCFLLACLAVVEPTLHRLYHIISYPYNFLPYPLLDLFFLPIQAERNGLI